MKRIMILLMAVALLLQTGCGETVKPEKLRDLEMTVLSQETLPKDLKELIEKKKEESFQFTFSDHEALYICLGYGRQEVSGYSIMVDELYETRDAIYVATTLLGPEKKEDIGEMPSYPYIVIKTEPSEKPVMFE